MTRFYTADGTTFYNVDQIVSLSKAGNTVELRLANEDVHRIDLVRDETILDFIAEIMEENDG